MYVQYIKFDGLLLGAIFRQFTGPLFNTAENKPSISSSSHLRPVVNINSPERCKYSRKNVPIYARKGDRIRAYKFFDTLKERVVA